MNIFQSTLPVKGATCDDVVDITDGQFQSTLPVKGATNYRGGLGLDIHISIHAPREGSDDLH